MKNQKLVLAFPIRSGTETAVQMIPSERASDLVVINQINGMGQIKQVNLTYKEANELREWLNFNLPR